MKNAILSPDIEKSIVKQLRQQSAKSKKIKVVPDKDGLELIALELALLFTFVLLVILNIRLLEQFN